MIARYYAGYPVVCGAFGVDPGSEKRGAESPNRMRNENSGLITEKFDSEWLSLHVFSIP
jgi:hypothetical protein